MPNLWIPTGVMSEIDAELLRLVKTEKLLGMSKNTTLVASEKLMLEVVMPTDF